MQVFTHGIQEMQNGVQNGPRMYRKDSQSHTVILERRCFLCVMLGIEVEMLSEEL
jgi:hypothetical protein